MPAPRWSPRWHPLEWDTAFFGRSIGRIDLHGAERRDVERAEAEARAAGVECLYASVDPIDLPALRIAQRLGYVTVDAVLDLDHPTSVLVDRPPTECVVRTGTAEDVPRLEEQFVAVAPWSRFTVDPRFGIGAAIDLHRAWAERAADGIDGRSLLVAEGPAGITGFCTVRLPRQRADAGHDRRLRIDLIATTRPGSGTAQALVHAAFGLGGPGPSDGGPIAARNATSLRFSEQMGYRVVRCRYLMHRWLVDDEEVLDD